MAKTLTIDQAVQALRGFEANISKAVLRGLETGAQVALKISGTKFFQGGQGPPNPPPGPLKIRSGTLRRGTTIIRPFAGPGDTWITGLQNAISYAKFHEQPEGVSFRIAARQFMTPALEEATPLVIAAVEVELQNEAERTLG